MDLIGIFKSNLHNSETHIFETPLPIPAKFCKMLKTTK